MKTMKKRLFCLILTLAMAAALCVPAGASGTVSRFTDVTDEALALELEELYTLGVINGVGNDRFNPGGKLTRAQFCKMAIEVAGRGSEVARYQNRTIFSDVTASHWARGYINLAASGDNRIISGMGNGKFSPDTNITYAQAVTILVRMLGYSDADAGSLWPQGYLGLAEDCGLSRGLSLSANSSITRAQAAHLFCSLLACYTKDGAAYLEKLGSVTKDVILTSVSAVYADGSDAIRTSAGLYRTASDFSESLLGRKGTLVLNSAGKAILFLPDDSTVTDVAIETADAAWVKDAAGIRYNIPSAAVTYTSELETSWREVWLSLRAGTVLTLVWTDAGTVSSVYIHAAASGNSTVMVVKDEVSGNPFAALSGGTCTMLKNGAPATAADIRRYDVGAYNPASNTLRITDTRLVGVYENASPSPSSPETITVMGHVFPVLSAAQTDLQSFSLGQRITLLLTEDGKVAGVVAPTGTASDSNAIGVVTEWAAESACVTLLNVTDGLTGGYMVLSGKPASPTDLTGELVNVSSTQKGSLTLGTISRYSGSSALDVSARTLGTAAISPAVRVFERVGKNAPVSAIAYSDIVPTRVAASDVLYTHSDWAGRIDLLILGNITGDTYTYGFLTAGEEEVYDYFGASMQHVVYLDSPSGSIGPLVYSRALSGSGAGGVVLNRDGSLASLVELTQLLHVQRSAFQEVNGTLCLVQDGLVIPVADDVVCYNKSAGVWFTSLAEARAFSRQLTVYYDRESGLGGKVRLVVTE